MSKELRLGWRSNFSVKESKTEFQGFPGSRGWKSCLTEHSGSGIAPHATFSLNWVELDSHLLTFDTNRQEEYAGRVHRHGRKGKEPLMPNWEYCILTRLSAGLDSKWFVNRIFQHSETELPVEVTEDLYKAYNDQFEKL